MESMERRIQTRTPARLKVKVGFASAEKFTDFYTRNISQGGIFIEHGTSYEEGTPVEVVLNPPHGDAIALFGKVAHCSEKNDNPGMGIELEAITDDTRRIFEGFLSDFAGERTPPPPGGGGAALGDAELEKSVFEKLAQEVEDFLEETAEADAYTILGVDGEADRAGIDGAYRKLTSRYSPDPALDHVAPDLYALLRRARNRIYDAYKTVSDAKTREIHDASFGLMKAAEEVQTPVGIDGDEDVYRGFRKEITPTQERIAENLFKEGCALLSAGNRKAAAMKLRLAAQFDPANERYRSKLAEAAA